MAIKLTPDYNITSNLCPYMTPNHTVALLDIASGIVYDTGLDFNEATPLEVIKKYHELVGCEFVENTEPIFRIVKVNDDTYPYEKSRYSAAVIAAKINYNEGTMSYGWSVAVKNDTFDKEVGKKIAQERLEKSPITVNYNPLCGIIMNVRLSDNVPHQLSKVIYHYY